MKELRGGVDEAPSEALSGGSWPASSLLDAPALAAPLVYEEARRRYFAAVEARIYEDWTSAGLLREMLTYQLLTGGKRIRALLPVWVCVNLGAPAEAALDLGAGLELLHNATLVHDDLQDGDTHRRGRPTIWRRWGVAQAINAGDTLIFEAFARLGRAPAGPRLLQVIAQTLVRVAEGQVMEFQLQLPPGSRERLPATLTTWTQMAKAKTGALFGACLRAGAAAAGASDALLDRAAWYGEQVGVLFQAQDDFLDLVGDKGRARRGCDLMEGKLSFPIAWAYENASAAIGAVRAILGRTREERTWAMADNALVALRDCGALAATATWLQEAQRLLERHPIAQLVPGWVETCLVPVTHALIGRHE